ncbi:MAG: sugar phosphate nucleotidyltransferase [Pelagibacteraceae bacterium]|tara:strand:+ start:4322 stop:5527 length:1206 start_codon:yes stop_codon:yes gene_type:complete
MKIRPVILCGGAGTRLWPNSKKKQAKQFIDFGGWTLLGKTLERTKISLFDSPIISTNSKYLKEIKNHLRRHKIRKYKIILEPAKKNTAPAILSSALIKDIPDKQPLIFLSADHLIEKTGSFNNEIKKNKKHLTDKNIFIFGIKPNMPSDQFGYFMTKKYKKNLNKVTKFLEKPNSSKANKIIKKGGYWNSGMFFIRKDSVINNFKKYQKNMYRYSLKSINKSKTKNNICYLNKNAFIKNQSKSFDFAILEKIKNINAIKLNINWSDLGSWREILLMYNNNKKKYFNKKNIFYRPWGKYTNLFNGNNFLIKEIYVKPKGTLSLQKHFHRSEHWVVTQGIPRITLNKKLILRKPKETIFIPQGAIHRIHNPSKKPVKIMEAQLGSILKETDIVRYKDIYGRVN